MKDNGSIVFKTHTQEMLWRCEITGQLSDGYWENTRPLDHWKFWCRLEPAIAVEGEVAKVTSDYGSIKRGGYNLHALLKFVGDRMLNLGRLATAGGDERACEAAEYMPGSLEEFEARKKSGKWQYDFVANYMADVSLELARRYYNTPYFMKDLRKDLNVIKKVMKTARSYA